MILVTGGTGLLGAHLLLELVKEHEEVVALKRPSSDLREVRRVFSYYSNEADELFSLIDWVDVDLSKDTDVSSVMIDIDQVFHCAAMVSFQPADRKEMIRNNVEITANIVNACLESNVAKLLHVSSSAAIGQAPLDEEADETMIWARTKTSTGYAISKFKSEMEVWRGMEEGLNAVIVNPTIIMGPGYWNRGSSSMFSRVDRGLKYYTTGVTGYVGVADVVMAMTGLMDSGITGERFIINTENLSYQQVFEMIRSSLGRKHTMKPVSRSNVKMISKLDAVAGQLTGRRRITREHLQAAFREARFSNKKIVEALALDFIPMQETIDHVAQHYRADHPRE